jgi:hypothetical protein
MPYSGEVAHPSSPAAWHADWRHNDSQIRYRGPFRSHRIERGNLDKLQASSGPHRALIGRPEGPLDWTIRADPGYVWKLEDRARR